MVLVAAAFVCVGCAESDEQDLARRASPSAEADATPEPEREPSPKKEVAKALARFTRSVKAEDAGSTSNVLDLDTVRYLKRLRRDVGTAGPGRIARLSPWDKLALTGLRTDFDDATLGALSVEGFLGYLLDYEEIFLPYEKVTPKRIRVDGPKAVVTLRGRARWRPRLELVRGSWRLDARPLFRDVDRSLARVARLRGMTVDDLVLEFGEEITLYHVRRDVWKKPG